ncbi:MAG: Mur ligase family protein [Dehalococcoidales bacterium]|nr:Mur ligase family protein [Dehalococcoidales bacterium]
MIGVTGTDGKTTTSTLTTAILEAAGYRTGLLTTVAARIVGKMLDTSLHTTTPDPLDFHRYLALMVEKGMEYAVIETTSHGLAQERTLGAECDVAAVANAVFGQGSKAGPEWLEPLKRRLPGRGRACANSGGAGRAEATG